MKPNVIILVVDTLRRDAIQPYNPKASTPNIMEFAKDSNVFWNAIAPSPWTMPSHASLFTGLYPIEHGVKNSPDLDLGVNFYAAQKKLLMLKPSLLSSRLNQLNYSTFGITANPVLSSLSGFDYGFDVYSYVDFSGIGFKDDIEIIRKKYGNLEIRKLPRILLNGDFSFIVDIFKYYRKLKKHFKDSGQPLLKGGKSILELLVNTSIEQPFLAFINLMEMHEPYLKKDFSDDTRNNSIQRNILDYAGIWPINNATIEKYKKVYDKESQIIDGMFGKLISHLKKSGIYDNTIIVLTSDHGQAMKEHGFFGHGLYLFDEIVNIPLLIKLPNNKKLNIKAGYQSLIGIKDFIIEQIDYPNSVDILTKDIVFSEESKRKLNITKKYEPFLNKLAVINSNRKAVFKDGFKLVVNGDYGTVEEFSLNGTPVEIGEYYKDFKDLLEELEIFKGNEKFNMPDGDLC